MSKTQKILLAIIIAVIVIIGLCFSFNHSAGTASQNPPAESTDPGTAASSSNSLSIASISPQKSAIGTLVTITGTGFAQGSQILLSNGAIHPQVNSATSLTFAVPNSIGAYCKAGQACPMFALLLKPGNYSLSIKNDDGSQSNSVPFEITQ